VHEDDERADFLLKNGLVSDDGGPAPRPPLFEWSKEVELLAEISDLLKAQRADTGAINSKNHKWKKPQPTPRPQSAIERAQKRFERRQHDDIVAKVLRNRDQN